MEWKKIETFPIRPFCKDGDWWAGGDRVLLTNRHNVVVGRYSYTSRGKGRWLSSGGHIFQPTHWMAIPELPKVE